MQNVLWTNESVLVLSESLSSTYKLNIATGQSGDRNVNYYFPLILHSGNHFNCYPNGS